MIECSLIDGDLIAYRCAAVNEQQDTTLALWQTSEMMRKLIHDTNAMDYRCYLSGTNNFRYDIYPEYKANRKDVPKPRHLQAIREHLVTDWKATVTDGIEADDAMGIEQCARDGDTMIVSLDKDMLMIPGRHYNFVRCEFRHVSPLDGLRHFYWQLIMGDRADNIPGFDGKMRNTVPKFLQGRIFDLEACTNEWEMYTLVHDMWEDKDMFEIAAQCLWIHRKENDKWVKPVEEASSEEGMDGGTT